MVDRQDVRCAVDRDVQSIVIEALVAHVAQHGDLLGLQRGAVNPAGGLVEPCAKPPLAALQQPDLSRGCLGLGILQAGTVLQTHVHAPLARPAHGVGGG